MSLCDVNWGSHGCQLPRGHDGHHFCCCECPDHDADHEDEGCVGTYPYYGPQTVFYGKDAPLSVPQSGEKQQWRKLK